MTYNKTLYVIVPTREVTREMVKASSITSFDTLRKSLDGTKCILKCEPENRARWFGDYRVYLHEQILDIVHGTEWELPDED